MGSGLITLVTPDGVEHRYVGSAREVVGKSMLPGEEIKDHKVILWSGSSSPGTAGAAALDLAYGDSSLSATIREGSQFFQLIPLPGGRMHVLAEIIAPSGGVEDTPYKGGK
jgi:hypothetical protein